MAGMKQLGDVALVKQGAGGKVVPMKPSTSTAVALVGPLPAPPAELVFALETFANPHPDTGPDRSLVTQAAKDAALVRLRHAKAQARNATVDEWCDFLFPLCNPLVTANPPDPDDVGFMVPTIGYMPVGCLSRENFQALVARKFFPKPGELMEVMAADKRRIVGEVAALERILAVKVQDRPNVAQRRAEDELLAWIEAAARKPEDVRGIQVRACIRRLGAAAPALLARHRERLEALLPSQAPQEPPQEPLPPARGAVMDGEAQEVFQAPVAAPAAALAAREALAAVARARMSGRTLAQVQAEAARQVDVRDA